MEGKYLIKVKIGRYFLGKYNDDDNNIHYWFIGIKYNAYYREIFKF